MYSQCPSILGEDAVSKVSCEPHAATETSVHTYTLVVPLGRDGVLLIRQIVERADVSVLAWHEIIRRPVALRRGLPAGARTMQIGLHFRVDYNRTIKPIQIR